MDTLIQKGVGEALLEVSIQPMHLKLNWVLLDECTILWGKPDRAHVQKFY